jgi:hypothetical protein
MRLRFALVKKRSSGGEGIGFHTDVVKMGEICRLDQAKNPNVRLKKLQMKFEIFKQC